MQCEAVVPEFLRIMEDAASDIAEMARQEDYMGHIFAMYLLAQFREERAYQPLVELVSSDSAQVDAALGDVITEDLGRMLASVCNGDTSLIRDMIENPDINEYVRSAGLDALVVLVSQNVKTRNEVVAYFRSLFRGKLEREFSFVWSSLISKCCMLRAGEIAAEIERAFADGIVDTGFIGLQSVRRDLAKDTDDVLARLADNPHCTFIEDTAHEMSGWPCFQKPRQSAKTTAPEKSWMPTPVRTVPKVGRNESCPCGSSKKYKKCCGGV